MWFLYQVVMLAALLLGAPFLFARRFGHYKQSLRGRLALGNDTEAAHPLWIHAVSVGEVEVARTFVQELQDRLGAVPVLLTTVTPTGQLRAKRTMPSSVRVTYLPFELGFVQRRFLRLHQPASLVLVEGEMWPLLMRTLKQRPIPITMINGRISDRSFARLRRIHGALPALLRPLLDPVDHFGVQTAQDGKRLKALGVDAAKISVTGNLKFDAPPPPEMEELERSVRGLAQGRPVLVAGSTMPEEEQLILDALGRLHDQEPLLLLAPRHPERFDEVFRLCQQHDFRTIRRTSLDLSAAGSRSEEAPVNILLLDSLGELASAYRWATGAFVGGTLVPTGGHNPIEPARCGAPTSVGPSMENFREIAAMFDAENAWARVRNSEDLADTWRRWIEHPEAAQALARRAQDLIDRNQGAVARSMDLVLASHPTLDLGAPAPSLQPRHYDKPPSK